MEKYQYTTLTGARQIRLLKLHAGAEADELAGELVHTSLDETPSFTALSYAWGDPQPRKAIRCSGLRVEIGPSLHSALRHLRQPGRETFLWADALCINQEDDRERSQQVRMMGDIYAAAASTALWLGEESDEVKMAFGWLRSFATARESVESGLPASKYDSDSFITRSQAERTLEAAFGRCRATAFLHIWALLGRPWFTRKWVIQELLKSRRPLLVAGRLDLPWALLAGWMIFLECCLSVKKNFIQRCPQPLEAGGKVLGVNMLRATLLTRIAVPEKQLLLFLIVQTLEFRCGDPRDHVFALVGIASDAACFDLIDYGSPGEKISRRLAHACVSDSMNLKLLWSLVYLAPLGCRLRSWVPDLEKLAVDRAGSILATQLSAQPDRDYNASGDTVLQTYLADGGNMLMIRGRIVDRLQRLGSNSLSLGDGRAVEALISRDGDCLRENLQTMHRPGHQWLSECLAIAKTTSTASGEEAFQDALLGDQLSINDVPKSMAVARSEFSTQIHLYKAMAYERDYENRLSAFLASSRLKSSYLLGSKIIDRQQRRFGRTEKGRLGWLPPVAEEGDLICVFDGMELPYAIRPAAGGRYLLVGECIIRGLMMGEAMEFPRVAPETFVLE